MLYIVDYLKAIACLLITNFHFDIVYPYSLSILAIGGDIGNNIFFAISGFTLFSSVNRTETSNVFRWYFSRIKKLMPMIIFFYMMAILLNSVQISNIGDVIRYFIFPTIFWFTGAILVFYFLFFIVIKLCNKKMLYAVCGLLVILHIIFDGVYAERYLTGFFAMLMGYYLHKRFNDVEMKSFSIKHVCMLVLAGIAYVVMKLLRMKAIGPMRIVHLGIGFSTVVIALLLIYGGWANDNKLKTFSEKYHHIYGGFKTLSKITLPVYLVQQVGNRFVIHEIIKYCSFPVSYIACFGVIVLGAFVVSKIDGLIQKRIAKG